MFSKGADLFKMPHKIAGIILILEFTEWSETSSLNFAHVYVLIYTVHNISQENAYLYYSIKCEFIHISVCKGSSSDILCGLKHIAILIVILIHKYLRMNTVHFVG
jgi:hypothetical protein